MAITPVLPLVRRHLFIRGIVQGVGFRPFVFNLARSLHLSGYVLNSSAGVEIEAEGAEPAVEEFLSALRMNGPPLAQITDISISEMPPQADEGFAIRESREEDHPFVLVSPDVATCDDCWRDFGDPDNRRYGYPFTNCTNCGPRYTIVRDIPYDRPKTTMAHFRMCAECHAEYEDPGNRRFHAQPNACAACGPGVALLKRGSAMPDEDAFADTGSHLATMQRVRERLHDGGIVAIKGLGGFLLACDAQNAEAIATLRLRKRRSDKPFALMARDLASVSSFCFVSDEEGAALQSTRRPIVILRRRPGTQLPEAIAPGNDSIGVMLPYTPLHYLLFSDSPHEPAEFPALVMTSGNLSDEPIVTANDDALKRLDTIADWFLLHNRNIFMRADDSVVRVFQGRERVLRRSRGYVPRPVELGMQAHELLACGAELKNTFCLTKDRYAILSQHIGDFENYESLRFFEETLANLTKLFRVEPQAVAYDLHPNYMSTRFALRSPIARKIGVQHHHAHIASCMAENHLRGKVIGVALDGTGYGTDGKIWGGEFLIAGFIGFERRAHLRYLPLPGGDAAVRQPWRMALSYLRDSFGGGPLPANPKFLQQIPSKQIDLVDNMIARRVQTIDTSSCGRLFDAVAVLVGLGERVTFEGQAAIALEAAAWPDVRAQYAFDIHDFEAMEIDMRPMIGEVVRDLSLDRQMGYISACFHNTVAAAVVETCRRMRRDEGLNRVCLSGGVFQNMILLERVLAGLRESSFDVYTHALIPPNDGGISLGQAVIANALLQQGV